MENIMPQDPRVKATKEEIEEFFVYIAGNEEALIIEMLDENPTLVYAKDEQGDTALYNTIIIGTEESLSIMNILIQRGVDINQSRIGEALQFNMEPDIRYQMAKMVGINLKNVLDDADDTIKASKAYNKKQDEIEQGPPNSKKETKGSGKCTIMSVHEITYGEELQKLFQNMSQINMDEQKKINQATKDFYNPIIDYIFGFSPSSFYSSSKDIDILDTSNNDLSNFILGALLFYYEISHHA